MIIMFKAILKKQLCETAAWLIQNKKTGKRRSTGSAVGMILLYAVLLFYLGFMFYRVGRILCIPLIPMKLDWLYFAIMGLISIAFGVFGSVFNTYATVYKAKDNELLLSLPLPASYIMAARLFGVWLWSLIYESVVFVPALIAYWKYAEVNAFTVIFDVLLLILLSVFILTLSCILGWVVAKISSKLKNKTFVTVIISILLIAIYYWGYSKAYGALQSIVENADKIGANIKGYAYPVYLMGKTGEGDAVSALLVTAIIAILFAIVLFVMSRSFINIVTSSSFAATKVKHRERKEKCRSVSGALLFKEFKRFTSSAVYMLNCALGTVILPVLGITVLIKSQWLRGIIDSAGFGDIAPLIGCAGMCFLASMNNITAPSVSLEGKNLWIVRVLPVSEWQILAAKLKLHLIMTEIPIAFCAVCISIALRQNVFESFMMLLISLLFVLLFASLGLILNLKFPNLNWTNETVPVKQSIGVLLALFGGWFFIVILGAIYFALCSFVSPIVYLIICALFIAALAVLLLLLLKKYGTKMLSEL